MPLLIELPVILQGKGHDCGDALFGCITTYFEQKRRRTKCDPWRGKHPMDMEPEFRKLGYSTFSGQFNVELLKAITGNGVPVCCLVQRYGGGHWVAVRGVRHGRVHIMDPADGLRPMKIADWEASWYDSDHHGTKYMNHGLAVWC